MRAKLLSPRFGSRYSCRTWAAPTPPEPPKSTLPVLNQEARDPVCGMTVNVSGAKYKSEHQGSQVYFCCAGCKQAFDRQPDKCPSSISI